MKKERMIPMEPTYETINIRAVRIAAKIMQAGGLCRHDNPMKCRRIHVDANICDKCIRAWLLAKARKELKEEAQP